MSRFLFWIILFGAAYWFWHRAKLATRRAAARGAAQAASAGSAAPRTPRLAEPMVRCAYCGVHAPRSGTVGRYRLHFCSADHAARYVAGEAAGEATGDRS